MNFNEQNSVANLALYGHLTLNSKSDLYRNAANQKFELG